jgi:hypothetical protein
LKFKTYFYFAHLTILLFGFNLSLVAQTGHIIWQDDFNSIDPTVWNIDQGDGCDEGPCGWGNFELQSYQNENVYIEEIPGEPGKLCTCLRGSKRKFWE